MYNGMYRQVIDISVKSSSHKNCLHIASQIKKFCDVWSFCVKCDEHKSARKGDVLKRDFLIYQNNYAHTIITFAESLRVIAFHFNFVFQDTSVVFSTRSVERIDADVRSIV